MRGAGWARWGLPAGLLVSAGLPARAEQGSTALAPSTHRLAQPDAARFPEVRLFAYPTDSAGRVLPNLSPRQFRVLEDGTPATVLQVLGGEAGSLAVCLVLDRSGSMDNRVEQGLRKLDVAQDAARQFVRALRRSDRAAVLSYAGDVSRDCPLTDRKEELLAALSQQKAYGPTALYDAIHHAVDQVALRPSSGSFVSIDAGLANARRAVLVLTDGNDAGSTVSPGRVLDHARANGVSVYLAGFGTDLNDSLMGTIAHETGGDYFATPSSAQVVRMYHEMARRLREEYRVAFRSPRPEADATRREVTVTVEGTLLPPARAWYQAPGRGSMVVTVDPSPTGSSNVETGGPGAPSPVPGVALLLLGLGCAGLAAAGLAFLGLRCRARLPKPARSGATPATAGPGGVDFGELWAHAAVMRIGRDPGCELIVQSPRVSRRHARVEQRGDEFYVVDEGSNNGTFVNGARVQESSIRPGDQVRFGNAVFRFMGMEPEGTSHHGDTETRRGQAPESDGMGDGASGPTAGGGSDPPDQAA